MTDDESRLDALVREALDLGDDGRARLLDRLRDEDPQLAEGLQWSLRALETHTAFLAEPPLVDLRDLAESDLDRTVAPRPLDLELPCALEGYELVERIGQGGMSSVYRARQRLPRRETAVKVIPIDPANEAMRRRIHDEAHALARLRHPGIAQLYEARIVEIDSLSQSAALISMELVEGAAPLDANARRSEMDRRDRIRMLADVADAVHHAHQRGVIHRDLKPANILVDAAGVPRIIDFGIARMVDRDEGPLEGIAGSWRYMSPEHLAGAGEVEVRSDLYSLAVVAFELVCGEPPYGKRAQDLGDFIRALRTDAPTDPSAFGVDADLSAILIKALCKDPNDRYASVAAFADDLRRYLRDEPPIARPPSFWHATRLLSRRRRVAVRTGAAASLLLVVGIVVAWVLYARSERLSRDLSIARVESRLLEESARSAREELAGLQDVMERAIRRGRNDARTAGLSPLAFDFVGSVSESVGAAETNAERRLLVEVASDMLRRIEPKHADDPDLRAAVAETYLQIGDLNGLDWLATAEEAASGEAPYRRAAEIWTDLLNRDPSRADALVGLSRAAARLSQTLRKLGRHEAALAWGQTAVDAADRRVEQGDTGPDPGVSLVEALWARGDACIGLQDSTTGISDSARAVAVSEELLKADQCDRDVVAWSNFRLSVWMHRQLGDLEGALPYAMRANDLHLAGLADDPSDARTMRALVEHSYPEISLLRELGRDEDAAARRRTLLEGIDRAVREGGHPAALVDRFLESTAASLGKLEDPVGRRTGG